MCGTCLVATAVVKVVVGGDVGDDVHAKVSGSCLKLGDVVGIDGGCLLGVVVDEEVGVVVVADGNGDDLHGSESPENSRHAQLLPDGLCRLQCPALLCPPSHCHGSRRRPSL